MVAAILSIFVVSWLWTRLGCEMVDIYEVKKVEPVRVIGWRTNSAQPDDLYYLVYTDKGMFKIELSGLNAYGYGAQRLYDEKGTVTLKTRGVRLEIYGLFPNIIEVVEKDAVLGPGKNCWQ